MKQRFVIMLAAMFWAAVISLPLHAPSRKKMFSCFHFREPFQFRALEICYSKSFNFQFENWGRSLRGRQPGFVW
jgi:hypothetical protein